MAVDEVLINGRRYRVPERIVVLDFWNKVSAKANVEKYVLRLLVPCYFTECPPSREGEMPTSGLSSPLTSLSSLEDLDERIPSENHSAHDADDLMAAQVGLSLSLNAVVNGL